MSVASSVDLCAADEFEIEEMGSALLTSLLDVSTLTCGLRSRLKKLNCEVVGIVPRRRSFSRDPGL